MKPPECLAFGAASALEFDECDGQFVDAQAAVIWQAFDHLGFGVGCRNIDTRVDVDGGLLDGRLEWKYSGLMALARASF